MECTYDKVSALIKFLKINFSEELSKKVEDQLHYVTFIRLKQRQQIKLIITYLQLNELVKAQNIIEKSTLLSSSKLKDFSYRKEKPIDKYRKLKEEIEEEGPMTPYYRQQEFLIEQLEAYPKLIRVCLQLNKIQEAKDLFEKVTTPYTKVLAQIHFLKISPSKSSLEKTMNDIEKMPSNPVEPYRDDRNPYNYKVIAKIKFVKVFFINKKHKT